MIASLVLVVLVTLSGMVITYLYDETASFGSRLCSGVCLGLGILGMVGFIVASFIGLTDAAILISTFITITPLAILSEPVHRQRLKQDLDVVSRNINRLFVKPDAPSVGYVVFYLAVAVIMWKVFSRAMIQDAEGISTGLLNNFGDLPFHLSVITGFAHGNNFPPQDPTYAGVRFTYPFMSDFISAVFVRCGADLRESMFIENFVLALSFVGLVHRWALVMLRDRVAAIITPFLVLLNGGFGWALLISKADQNDEGLFGVFKDLPPSFTVIPETTWRWGNAVSALLVPQRGFLMGLPLAVLVFTQWWLATEASGTDSRESGKKARRPVANVTASTYFTVPVRRMIAAGVAAGLLPLIHAHSFVVVMSMAGCIALIQLKWREWLAFFAAALVISVPQLLWSTSHSAVNASTFFAWQFGWDHGDENPFWFWLKNTGLFIPLILIAILMRGRDYLVPKRLLLFYLPFTLCFIVPNLVKMAPWIWDNIKVLYYWWLASAPIVALLLARLWRQGTLQRFTAIALFVSLTFAGALDVAGITLRSVKYGIFDPAGLRFAEIVKEKTPPRSLIVQAPVHNTPVFLTGRRSLMGYPGHIWTHGLEFAKRENEIKRIYAGAPDAEQLMKNYDVEYAVVGPQERLVMPVNDRFFARFEKVGETGEYKLYKIKR